MRHGQKHGAITKDRPTQSLEDSYVLQESTASSKMV